MATGIFSSEIGQKSAFSRISANSHATRDIEPTLSSRPPPDARQQHLPRQIGRVSRHRTSGLRHASRWVLTHNARSMRYHTESIG